MPTASTDSDRRRALLSADTLCALTIASLSLGLYVATLQPDLGGPEDTPKFQFLGYVLGTAHAPGYPLYSMLSHLFVKLPVGTIAYRANLFSAVMAALASALAYLIARQLGSRRWASLGAAAGLATGYSFWTGAVFAEVYSLAAVMAALTICLLLAWGARGGTTLLFASVAAFGLGLGNHLTIVGLLPGAVCYVLLRDRRVLTARVIAAATAVLLVCVSQYGFIIIRTYQGAPYLESSAKTLGELFRVITAERFANQRFAFSLPTLLTVQVPGVATVIGRELGVGGALLVGAGLIAAARRRSLAAGLVASGAAGMLVMIVNLRGDTNGFITPVMALLWPLAGYGIDVVARGLQSFRLVLERDTTDKALFADGVDANGRSPLSLRRVGINIGSAVLLAAAVVPLANLARNYAHVDQSANTTQAAFFRALIAQLPNRAAVVADDYLVDSVLQYLMLTGAAGPERDITRLGFGASFVRAAARDHRRVFALPSAVTFFGAEGLRFERTKLPGIQLDVWLRGLPEESVVIGATAFAPIPFESFGLDRRSARMAGPIRHFGTFALVIGQPAVESREDDVAAVLQVDARLLTLAQVKLPDRLVASADDRGARIEVAGRTVVEVESGLTMTAFSPNGALLRALEFPAGEAPQVPLADAVYELKGEAPCVTVSTDTWTDISPALSTGSLLTTITRIGSVSIDTEFAPPGAGRRPREVELLGGGTIRTLGSSRTREGGEHLITEISRTYSRRPVFRLAFDGPSHTGRARIQSGGVQSSVVLCAHMPTPLFFENSRENSRPGVVTPDRDGEAYFGAGWGAPEGSATGSVRRGESGATLHLPLDAGNSYRVLLDVAGESTTRMEIRLNGVLAGTCRLRARCEVTLLAANVRPGINGLTLSVDESSSSNAEPMPFTFRGARIWRLRAVTPSSTR